MQVYYLLYFYEWSVLNSYGMPFHHEIPIDSDLQMHGLVDNGKITFLGQAVIKVMNLLAADFFSMEAEQQTEELPGKK